MSEVMTQLNLDNEYYAFDDETKAMFADYHSHLDILSANQVSIYGVGLKQKEPDSWTVWALITNTTPKVLKLKEVNLALLNKDGQAMAKKAEDFRQIRQMVAPQTAVAIEITYRQEDFLISMPSQMNHWRIAFEKSKKRKRQRMDWTGMNIKQLDPAFKKQMEEGVSQTDFVEGEINFSGLDALKNADGSLIISLLVSNASDDFITLRQISLSIFDASEDLAAQGTFPLKPFRLSARTSRPMLLEFPPQGIVKKDMDLSSWRLEVHGHP